MAQASLVQRIYLRSIFFWFWLYFRIYHRLHIEGADSLPKHGPLLATINHISLLEPFASAVAAVNQGIWPGYDVYTVAKKELFAFSPIAAFLKSVGMFPIDRARADMGAMRTLLTYLKQNKIVALAPEGTRSPTGRLQAFQPVVAKIAISRRLPILPIGAIGSDKALPVGSFLPRPLPITIRFGEIYELSEFYRDELTDEQADRASWVMREHVAALLPEWMRELPPSSVRVGTPKVAA